MQKMRSKSVGGHSRFLNIIKCPFRVLARARDLYMQSLTAAGAGAGVSYGNAMGCPTPHIPSLPRSLSVSSSTSSASMTATPPTRRKTAEAELRRTKSSMPLGGGGGRGGVAAVPRSKTVAYGRIEEEREFDVGDDERMGLVGGFMVYPRSRSYVAASARVKLQA